MKKKFLSVVLALAMVLSLMPAAFAVEGEPAPVSTALPEAVDGVITLTENTDISATGWVVEGEVTLDLAGCELKAANTAGGNIDVPAGASLTLKDSVGTGKVYTETNYTGGATGYAVIDVTGGNFTMESGFVQTVREDPADNGQFALGIGKGGTMTINGGKVEAGWYAISGNGTDIAKPSNVVINGGELISTADYALYLPHNGETTVKGGTVYGAAGGVSIQRGTLNIRDNAVVTSKGTGDTGNWGDGTGGQAAAAVNIAAEYGDCTVNISGGKLAAEENALIIKADSTHKISFAITGGKFSSDVSEYLPEGYIQNAEGVVQKLDAGNAVAQVGDQYFATLPSAVAAVQGDGTVTMLRDASGAGVGTFKGAADGTGVKNFTIDFGGHTYTCTGPAVGSAGTQSQAFHLEWNGNDQPNAQVILKNGTITSTRDSGVRMIVQNYCDLTLENMIVDGSNLQAEDYTVSNNCGNVTIQDTTIIEPKAGGFAFDSCDYASYTGVCVTVKGSSYIQGAMECTNPNGDDEAAKIIIESGHFTSDPSAYVANGKAALPGTEPGYAFTVGDKVTTDVVVKPAAGDPVVDDSKLPSMSDEDKTAITNVAASVKDDGVLAAAANSVVNTVTQEEKGDAEAALKAPGSGVEVQENVTTYVQAYLDIKPTAYDNINKTFTLDITPMYRVVASTAEQADKIVVVGEAGQGETANAVVLEGSEKKLTNLQTMTISITLPGSWSVTNNQVYVQHKGHEYVATVAGNVATFTNPHGFSAFVVSTTPAAAAEVNGDRYMNLTDALNAAENGNTVTILKAPDANTNFSMSGDTRTIKVKNGTESNLTVTINGEKHENVKANESFEVKYTRPSSGGGSSSTTYAVNVEKAKHGSVDSNRSRASSGTTVTLTVQPDNGYELDELTVTDKNGNELKLTKKSDTKYTFTMPKSAVTVEATFVEESKDMGYSDVSADAWYADAVQYVSDKGMMQGNNGKFMPADKLNRGQMAQVIFNLEGHQTVNYAMSFGDVKGSEWFAEAVRWAASEKIVSGYDNGNFGPNDPITREQLAVILFRYAQYKGMDTVTLEENLTGFADADEISGYAVSALNWAVGAGVINGTGAGLAPKANATRSEVAQMLMNFDQNVVK
ncbi:S-layer homology domain-containing protein [bacterium 210917-SL.2.15]|nr:S-layer homology domain-containing protein [bacterium 210917-SL.2.15]